MAKMILVDGEPHRIRRGKIVKIPPEWVGKITTDRTIRQRDSKLLNKVKRRVKHNPFNCTSYEYIISMFKGNSLGDLDEE